MSRIRRDYTSAQKNEMRRLRAEGMTFEEIGRRMEPPAFPASVRYHCDLAGAVDRWLRSAMKCCQKSWATRHAYMREYYRENGDRMREQGRRKYHTNSVKHRAKDAVRREVDMGRFHHPEKWPCMGCWEGTAEEYHHWSYKQEDWLSVIPLHRSCHRKLHRGRGKSLPQAKSREEAVVQIKRFLKG